MAAKKKPLIGLALGLEPGDSEESPGTSGADALKEMFAAAKSGDFEAAYLHLEEAVALCTGGDEESDLFAEDEE